MARVLFVEGVSKRMSYEEVVASSGAGLQNAFQENKAYTPLTLFAVAFWRWEVISSFGTRVSRCYSTCKGDLCVWLAIGLKSRLSIQSRCPGIPLYLGKQLLDSMTTRKLNMTSVKIISCDCWTQQEGGKLNVALVAW